MNFIWKAIEKMGCLFSKRKKSGNAYLYKGDENDSSTADDNNGDSNDNTVSSSGGFGSGGFGSGGGAVSGGVKVCIVY